MTSNALNRQVIRLTAAAGLLVLMSCATADVPEVSETPVPARPARVVVKTPAEPTAATVVET